MGVAHDVCSNLSPVRSWVGGLSYSGGSEILRLYLCSNKQYFKHPDISEYLTAIKCIAYTRRF
jgi:hypothetical protein